MKKVEKIVLPIVSLLLVAAAIVCMVALYRNVDDIFKEEETTSNTSSTQKPSDTSSNTPSDTSLTNEPSDTNNDYVMSDSFYINESTMTGYRTISGVTYFFKVIEPVYNPTYNELNRYVHMRKKEVKSYASYEVMLEYSYDTLSWIDFSNDLMWQTDTFIDIFIPSNNDVVYVTYTQISGCTDPMYVLSDLNANVFFNSSIFKYEVNRVAG